MEAVLKKIEIDKFSNTIGLEMGMAIVNLAKERHQNVAVQVDRLNHTIFLHIGEDLPVDKHNWLRRKANVAKHFEESSLAVKNDLKEGDMTLSNPFALSEDDYIAKGGAIPVFVKDAGLVAIITVSGLKDFMDHQLIIDALKGKFFDKE